MNSSASYHSLIYDQELDSRGLPSSPKQEDLDFPMPHLLDYPSIANADRFSAFNGSAQQRSVRSLLLEPDGYLEDGFYRFGDDNYLSELSSNEMTDLQNPARADASFHKSNRSLHSAFPPVDSSKPFYHSPSFSLNLFGNDPAPRFHDGMNRMRPSSQKDLLSSPILSEPPLFSDIEPLVPQHRPPLFSERPSHSRMYSSPSFNAPSLFSHSAHPSDCLLSSHSRHNSELRGLPKDDFPPDFPSFAPAADIALPPEPVKKLPYACRDFKNGKCTRGENCRFLHVYEATDANRVKQKNVQICRDFLRGQCQRKNCKFLHTVAGYPDCPGYKAAGNVSFGGNHLCTSPLNLSAEPFMMPVDRGNDAEAKSLVSHNEASEDAECNDSMMSQSSSQFEEGKN